MIEHFTQAENKNRERNSIDLFVFIGVNFQYKLHFPK